MYLIDRGKLLMQMMHKFHYELPDGCNNSLYGDVIKVIEDAPLIEAEPVRYGRVIVHDGFEDEYYEYCSECKSRDVRMGDNYCPNCGCKMDKEE